MCIVEYTLVKSLLPVLIVTRNSHKVMNWMRIVERHTEERPHTAAEVSFVLSECHMTKGVVPAVGTGSSLVRMVADKLFDSSVICSGNEESSMKQEDTIYKLYGCGICCQSLQTMHCFHSHWLDRFQMFLHPWTMLLTIEDNSWSVLDLSGNLLRLSEFTLECTKYW